MSRMEPIRPPDAHFLSAAVGWCELGNVAEAKADLERIAPALRQHPDVLEVRWLIHAQEKNWDEGLAVAEKLVELAPERSSGWLHRAYALRRAPRGGLQAAWDALLPAFEKFPEEPIISYNLCCYACQLGRLDQARQWLQRAVKVAGKEKIKFMALNDDDLAPLLEEIKML
jgi:tetratricopeptide (TPR) repeat protein